jgi:hypothetical protein
MVQQTFDVNFATLERLAADRPACVLCGTVVARGAVDLGDGTFVHAGCLSTYAARVTALPACWTSCPALSLVAAVGAHDLLRNGPPF